MFATMNTIAGARMFNSEGSAVRGKFVAVPLPGTRVDNRIVRHNTLIYGNNLVIPVSLTPKVTIVASAATGRTWIGEMSGVLVLMVLPGSQLLVYPLLWFLMPSDDSTVAVVNSRRAR